ncbi:hypothetical protein ACET3Z_010466 [Daucus carota]
MQFGITQSSNANADHQGCHSVITQPDAPGLIFKNKISEDYVFRGLCMAFGKEDGKIIKEPGPLNSSDLDDLFDTGAAFASPFLPNDPVLDIIDQNVLGRDPGKPTPGG